MSLRRLPDGYTEVLYIQSSGTQYIDTGFVPNQDTRIDISAMAFSTADAGAGTGFIPYGAGVSYNSNAFECYTSGGQLEFNYANTHVFPCSAVANGIYNISHNKNIVSITGAASGSYTFPYTNITPPYTMTLFAIHRASVLVSDSMRLYSCKIYDNGNLIRDYIPCANADGEAGLWDRVNGVFYGNSGSGEFLINGELPSGYTQVEYIESSGTQYIDTGFKHNNNTRVVMDCDLISGTLPTTFGAWNGANNKAFIYVLQDATGYYFYGNNRYSFPQTNWSDRQTVDADKNKLYINGTLVTTAAESSFSCSYTMHLFGYNSYGTPSNLTTMKLYSCQIYDNGTPVRDFIPCINPSGTVGMWDGVNGVFYGNSGSGSFTAGAVVIFIPDTPANLTADASESAAVLRWDASEGADGYRIRRNGVFLADTPDTAYTDKTVSAYTAYTYTVTAYNADGESESAAVSVMIPGSENVLGDLITDRKLSDVTARNKKGVYNAADLNRVSTAAAYVRALLTEYGYLCGTDARADWEINEIPRRSGLEAHYASVSELDVIRYAAEKLKLPGTAEKLTWEDANVIEAFLLACGRAAERIPDAWVFSGECICGEI